MALVGLIAKDAKARRELQLAIEELGHRVAPAIELREALEMLNRERPQLMVVVESPAEKVAERLMGELDREAPLLPVLVALTERKAARAFELLKAGALDVLASPWTPENIAACLSKALRFKGTSFELVSPRPASRGPWSYVAAVVVVLGIAAGYGAWERRRRPPPAPAPPTSWSLPYAHPAGLAFDGRELWVTEWFSQSIHRHALADLRVTRTAHLPKEIPGALTFAADALWVASAPRSVVKHMLDERLSALQWVVDARPQTVGMAYDGLYLWTCDRKGRLHKRILDPELTVVQSYDYPGSVPAALAYDGRWLWSLDAGNRELLRHDPARPEKIEARVGLPDYRSGQWKPTGLAWDGKRFWSVAESRSSEGSSGRIFVHAVAAEHKP